MRDFEGWVIEHIYFFKKDLKNEKTKEFFHAISYREIVFEIRNGYWHSYFKLR